MSLTCLSLGPKEVASGLSLSANEIIGNRGTASILPRGVHAILQKVRKNFVKINPRPRLVFHHHTKRQIIRTFVNASPSLSFSLTSFFELAVLV